MNQSHTGATRRLSSICGSILLAVLIAMPAGAAPKPKKEKSFGFKGETVTVAPPGHSGFLTGPNAGKASDVARSYVRQNKHRLGISDADVDDLELTADYTDEHNGVTHVFLRQQLGGLEVVDADLKAHVGRRGEIINVHSRLVRNLKESNQPAKADLSPLQAAEAVLAHLGLVPSEPLQVLDAEEGVARLTTISGGGVADGEIRAALVYQPVSPNKVRLAWAVAFREADGSSIWKITADAQTGEILAGHDYVDHDHWGEDFVPDVTRNKAFARNAGARGMQVDAISTVNDGSAYNVFAAPLESPNDGPSSWVMTPAHSGASPFGWHDTNGAMGAEFTITRGNNVHAYLDVDANNAPDTNSTRDGAGVLSQSEPNGGSSLQFNFPFDPSRPAHQNRAPAVVNLFYWNNIVHDVFYLYGFNEAAGNFQSNNYGRGAFQGDYVRAEAQDGSGTNNANFFTPPDGGLLYTLLGPPRMQMYVWTYPFSNAVVIDEPSPIAGAYVASGAEFGPKVTASGLTGQIVAGFDASNTDGPSTTDGCTALTNAVAGKIVLLDRGTCAFPIKTKNAQNAGAIGVVLANNVPGDPISMGGTDATITIPTVMVTLDSGDLFRAHLPFAATLRINPNPEPTRDSDLDAGVIAHEYGHGISNRLTGGRSNTSCLGQQEQMGEGWSDFIGLVLTSSPSDLPATSRGIGTYVSFQSSTGNGIRPTPYSTDMSINPSTYNTIKTAAVPHGVGYVWASMLWDMYWALVQKHGYNPNVYDPWHTGGNNLAIQLVMDGMKLQPCNPGFVTGRDAILQADMTLTGGANQCEIWRAFARRGLGVGASQGSANSVTDGVESYLIPASCPAYSTLTVAAVAGECGGTATLTATLTSNGTPVAGKTIAFTLNGGTFGGNTAVTNASGVATLANASLHGIGVGSYPAGAGASFPGDSGYLPATATSALVIADTVGPVITCPANRLVPTEAGRPDAAVHFTIEAADACSTATIVTSHASGSRFPVGTTTVHVTATDAMGNVSACSFDITVTDNEAPSLVVPATIVTEFTSEAGASVSYTVTASDNYAAVAPVCAPASGSTFAIGTTVVGCTAIDAAGNSTAAAFNVTVQGARSVMNNVTADLQALRAATTDANLLRSFERAAADLGQALTPAYWIDETRVTAIDGDRVFQSSKGAASVLSSPAPALAERVIRLNRLLASVAISSAAASGGDATSIARARELRQQGDTFIAAGQIEAGVEQYRNSWSHAVKAVR